MPIDRWIMLSFLMLATLGCDCTVPAEPKGEKAASPPPEKEKKVIEWGPATSGLQTRVWLEEERSIFEVGEPIRIRFALRNVGEKEQVILRRGFWPNHRVDVLLKGKDVPLTKEGASLRKLFAQGGTQEKTAPQVVKAGALVESFSPVDLTKLFDLSAAGEYQARILYQDGKPIMSNEVTFNISAPK